MHKRLVNLLPRLAITIHRLFPQDTLFLIPFTSFYQCLSYTTDALVFRVLKPAGEEYVQIFFYGFFMVWIWSGNIVFFTPFLWSRNWNMRHCWVLSCALPVTTQPPLEDRKDPVLGLLFHIPGLGVLRGFGGTCEEGPGPRAGRVMAVP